MINNSSLTSSKPILGLLLLLILTFTLCKQKEEVDNNDDAHQKRELKKIDSLTIALNVPGKTGAIISTVDAFLNFYPIQFFNKTDSLRRIVKSIPKYYNTMSLNYLSFYNDGKKTEVIDQLYFIDEYTDTIEFTLDNSYRLKDHKKNIDGIYHDYKKLANKIRKDKKNNTLKLKQELDSLYNFYNGKYLENQKDNLRKLNSIYYYGKLQMLYPNNNEIDVFLLDFKTPYASRSLRSLLYNYIKNRINIIDYNTLNDDLKRYNNKQLLALAHFNFLSGEKNKGDKKYQPAIDWLKTTDFYKKDSLYIRKEIEPLSNEVFKQKLNRLELVSQSNKGSSLIEVLKKYPSDYYLIDFWATWCAPCIDGVKRMNKMKIPKDVKIISISLDQENDMAKWKNKTKELKQSISYWVNDKKAKHQDFLKFLDLSSIPRYIIIDKRMNLIDEAFLHPSEPQFLSKLINIKYANINIGKSN